MKFQFKSLLIAMLIFGISAGAFTLPAAAAARDQSGFGYRYISGRKYYRAYDIARYYRMKLRRIGKYYEINGARGRLIFNPGKRYGSFNYIVINYDYMPD